MARQRRIEFLGATYHVMARGDRKEPIVFDDHDRRLFLATLGEMCQRYGIVIHAYVLLENHYHLILETPEGNLVEGLKWFQNAYTRRINVKHDLWGHLFGGRYKAILIDRHEDYFLRAVDYVHLNPLRAGQVTPDQGLDSFPWCSLSDFMKPPKSRPDWLFSTSVFGCANLRDTPGGRRALLSRLTLTARDSDPPQAGLITVDSSRDEDYQATLQRGWYFGSKDFKASLLDRLDATERDHKYEISGGFSGSQQRDHGIAKAHAILEDHCRAAGVSPEEWVTRKANDPIKIQIAVDISTHTSASLDWIRENLSMGSRSHCSRLINDHKRALRQRALTGSDF